ncbi:MAG: 3D domain-containing protein [Armatimonadetes bacterium]|nr:3D domain-containing protein [Armatimonadota bacterium]
MRRRNNRLARTATLAALMLLVLMAVGVNRDDVVQAQRLETVSAILRIDGAERHVHTAQMTVGATLKDAGIEVGPLDVVVPATSERLRDGMKITIVRVREEIEAVNEPIPFDTVKTFTRFLKPGQVKVTKPGEKGEKLVRYSVRYEDGKPVRWTVVGKEVVRKPSSKMVAIGFKGHYTSRGEYRTRRILRMSASAYDPGPRSCGKSADGRTGCGLRAGYGVVAVDPRVIRLGSRLYIEGYGYAIAGDTGSAIKGNRIDLGFNTYREAIRFGRRNVVVHLLQR